MKNYTELHKINIILFMFVFHKEANFLLVTLVFPRLGTICFVLFFFFKIKPSRLIYFVPKNEEKNNFANNTHARQSFCKKICNEVFANFLKRNISIEKV